MSDDFIIIRRKDNKYNINKNGTVISDIWFDDIETWENEIHVYLKHVGWNYLKTDGTLLLNNYVKCAGYFFNNKITYIEVRDYEYKIINKIGNIISKDIFNSAFTVTHGYVKVRLNNKWNFINKQGKYVFKTWFNRIGLINYNVVPVTKNNKYNFINLNGIAISDVWFDDIGEFYGYNVYSRPHAYVLLNNNIFKLNLNGDLIYSPLKCFELIK